MIDFHSHILPNIDDGSTSMDETINLIIEAKQVGFTGIISTSHYIQGYYESDESKRKQVLVEVEKNYKQIVEGQKKNRPQIAVGQKKNRPQIAARAKKEPTPICPNCSLHLGSEIYITTEIIELIKNGKASTINNTRYVLFELPMNSKPLFAKEVVYRLIENGYKPIIAHPERYGYVQEEIEYVEELANMGALFQSNYGSIVGMYGSRAQKTIKELLKKDLVSFLGSDVHRTGQIYPKIPKILKKLSKIISDQKLKELTTLNAQKVLNDENI